jgi:hypothetical protein
MSDPENAVLARCQEVKSRAHRNEIEWFGNNNHRATAKPYPHIRILNREAKGKSATHVTTHDMLQTP